MGRAGGGGGGSFGGHSSGGFHGGGHSGGGRMGGGFSGGSSHGSWSGGSSSHNSWSGGSHSSWSGGGHSSWGSGSYYGGPHVPPPPRRSNGNNGGGCGCGAMGCGTPLLIILIIVACICIASALKSEPSRSFSNTKTTTIERSTKERTKLDAEVNNVGYYKDEIGWIYNSNTLEDGMREFYAKTGVSPYLYLTDNISGDPMPSANAIDEFARVKYHELFTDEAHLLVVFVDSVELEDAGTDFVGRYYSGGQIDTVMDEEALDILGDYISTYYYDSSLSEEEFFSKAFEDAGDTIMTAYKSPWAKAWMVIAIVGGTVVIVLVSYNWWKKAEKRKKEKAEETERILNTPLEKFGDKADELAKKYEDKSESDKKTTQV